VSPEPAREPSRGNGRHVVVTGAGTGIGRAIAERFAAEGCRLSLLARDVERLEAAAADLRARFAVDARAFACDVRDPAAVETAFGAAVDALGPLHVLVANSGIGGPNAPGPGDRFEDLVATNLTGSYLCARAAQARLAPGPEARHLVFLSSILGRIGVAGYTGYCASKAGLLGLTRALACELAPEEVQVNAVCPGWVDTDMAREGLDGMAEALGVSHDEAHRIAMQSVPTGRMGRPEEVAGVVAWLTSADARGVTGQGVDVNGGAFMI
jgi:NAD(P)-dependent dehydrogenase (short-subunit alcohol dehydrogenase family)